MLSLATLGMTLYVLLSGDPVDPVSNVHELVPETDSLKAAWVMVKDSLIQNR